MCGIAGIIKFHAESPAPSHAPPRDVSALHAMSAALAHRGPDGAGIYTDPRPHKIAALVHRRLAIIDLPCGTQPMPNEDGTVHVVFNGEIYNHAALRHELQSAGHTFHTDHSDTEVLVHGWEQWGERLPEKLLGMFAFAVWDTRPRAGTHADTRDTLFLARDRMGQKPLFYAPLEDGIVFGSTISSVLAWPEVPRRVPREQVALYLRLGYLPPPQTIYRDIAQVIPGAWVRLRGDVLDGDRYWRPQIAAREGSLERAKVQLQNLVPHAVESQLISDVPVACFLSGGIDSSIIAALMQKAVLARGGEPIRTVSVGFRESSFDETAYAATVARKIGSRHTRLEVRGDERVTETLEALMATSLGQPFADSSILPTHQLSKAVRAIAPVALSGDGADELFGGYDRYKAMRLIAGWRGILRAMPRSAPVGSSAKRERYRRLATAARAATPAEAYTGLVEIFSPELIEELLGESVDYAPTAEDVGLAKNAAPVDLAMARDQADYLPGDVLWKVDSASMSEALEVRSPFLDHRVVEAANSMDATLKIHGTSKRVLRAAFAAELPAPVQTRGKQGFGVPIGNWFRGHLRNDLRARLFDSRSFCRTALKLSVVERLLAEHDARTRDHTHRLFALFMLELWWAQSSAGLE